MVSVILPNFNHSSFLKARLESILHQTYSDFEILILDDFSSDDSWQYLEQFSNHKKVSHCIRNSVNSQSPFGLWELGFSLAKGKYIWIAETDDYSSPTFLESMVDRLERDDSIISHCRSIDFEISYDTGKLNSWWNSLDNFIWDTDFVLPGKELIYNYGRFKCPVVNVSSAVFRKDALIGINVPSHMKYAGDWYFWNQIFLKGKVSFVSNPLNFFRNHIDSATSLKNSILLDKYLEYLQVIKLTNKMLGLENLYDPSYFWFILLWKKLFYAKRIFGLFYSIKYLPPSFVAQLFR